MSSSSLDNDLQVARLEDGIAFLQLFTKAMLYLLPPACFVLFPPAENYVNLALMVLLFMMLNVGSTFVMSKKNIEWIAHMRRFGNSIILFFIPVTAGGDIPFWLISLGLIYSIIFIEISFWIRWFHVLLAMAVTIGGMIFTGSDPFFIQIIAVALIVTAVLSASAQRLLMRHIAIVKEAQHEAESANTTKDMLMSVIAHDLKGPFNGLISMMEILTDNREEFSEEELDQVCSEILKESKSTYSLLENLLIWSRAQRGVINYEKGSINIHKLATASSAPYLRDAHAKGVAIEKRIPEDIEIVADEPSMRILLSNLIHNAIKFTPENGTITLSANKDKDAVVVSVTDTGVGIPRAAIPGLLVPTVYDSTAGTNDEKGTGLGLGLCSELIKENGGFLEVDSTEGVGSTFRFIIPV